MALHDKILEAHQTGIEYAPEKLVAFYNQWALEGTHDQILMGEGYTSPRVLAGRLNELVLNKDARILDVGSGSGLVGEELAKLGFKNICAVDPSEESLNASRAKGCYKEFINSFVAPGKLDQLQDNSIDSAISSGAFFPGHCDGNSLKELVRVVKPGGHIIIAHTTGQYDNGYDEVTTKKATEELVAAKRCSFVREEFDMFPNRLAYALIYTVL